jgi:hypothetical protein
MADPEGPFHQHYLAYKRGQITRLELVQRLPHVAMIGDSLSRNVYVSSALATAWRAHRSRANGWFVNTEPDRTKIYSLFQRLDELTPLVATEYGGLGAMLGGDADRLGFFRKILRTRNFSGQVDRILSDDRFPDLILIWIGHNNVDWAYWCPKQELNHPEARLQTQREYFRRIYHCQLDRLLVRARTIPNRVAIVIYGLVDFASFFKARDHAAALRQKNPKLYPRLGAGFRYFVSLRPAYREHLVRLAAMVNDDLCQMADALQSELAQNRCDHVQVRYSDALAKVDLSRVEMVHPVDAWHPSIECHSAFAKAAFAGLSPALEFLTLMPSAGLRATFSRG